MWTRLSFKVWLLPTAPAQAYAAHMAGRLPTNDAAPHLGTTVFAVRCGPAPREHYGMMLRFSSGVRLYLGSTWAPSCSPVGGVRPCR